MTPSLQLVSVIIPAYNADRWLSDTIRSATSQTCDDIEIIVVDDGSTDETAEVASGFGDEEVRLIRQAKAGAGAARNRGLSEARGAFIQFLDADDVLAPDKIAKQMDALAGLPFDSVASCSWGRFTGEPESAVFPDEPVWKVEDPAEWLVQSLNGGGMMQPGAWLTPRSIIDAAGPWNESLTLHDDGEYFTRVLLKASRNVFVPEAKIFYRDVEGSLSRIRSRDAVQSAFTVCRLRGQHLLAVRDDKAARRAVATQYAQFAYEHGETAPDLAIEALKAIEDLGVSPNAGIGGHLFAFLSKVLGFRAALHLRHDLRATPRGRQ